MNFDIFLAVFFVVMLPATMCIHHYFLQRSTKQNIKKYNISAERWASQRKPMLGGAGFMAGFVIAVVVWFFVSDNFGQQCEKLHIGIIMSIVLAFVMGLIDDIFNTSPAFKFLMQFAVSLILIYSGVCIDIFDNQYLNYALTIFWIVGLMNSLNMLDNMDSVTNTMCVIVICGVLVTMFAGTPDIFFALILLGSLAAMLSFYRYNWHPSKMYMGDNGSQFLGVLLAIISIRYLWNPAVVQMQNPVYPFLIVYLAFLVPLTDTATVTVNRLMEGKSPFVGDTNHTTHNLSYRGLSDRQVVVVLAAVNMLSAAAAVYFLIVPPQSAWPLWTAGILGIIVSGLLYANTKIARPKTN